MVAARSSGRERQGMILFAIHEVSNGTTKFCEYEDIVVRAWELFPQEFGLRGYVERFPDASDLHKPLYGPLTKAGFVRVRNKKVALTDRGITEALRYVRGEKSEDAESGKRVARGHGTELKRLATREAVRLAAQGRLVDLVDTDLYDFYGVTVRTKPKEFAGRIAAVDEAVDFAVDAQDPSVRPENLAAIVVARDALKERYGALVADHVA